MATTNQLVREIERVLGKQDQDAVREMVTGIRRSVARKREQRNKARREQRAAKAFEQACREMVR